MMKNMNPDQLGQWSVWAGCLGVLSFLVSLILLWQGTSSIVLDKFDHKDFYYAGAGLLHIAIWIKLGAIFHQRK